MVARKMAVKRPAKSPAKIAKKTAILARKVSMKKPANKYNLRKHLKINYAEQC